jgi:hypothetical protein
MADQQTKEQPQVTVRNIPQNQYNENAASATQDPSTQPDEGGIKGHLKKNWPIYTVVLAIVTIIVIIWVNGSKGSSTTTGTDTTGYGTGNSSSSDLYGSQLDADYQQMINQENITNSLLQQLLGANTKTTTGGTSGSGSSSGSGKGHHKKPPSGTGGIKGKGGGKKTKPGGSTGGSGSYHGGSTGGHNKSGGTSSSHSTGTSHSSGKTTVSHGSSGYGKQKNYTTYSGGWKVTGPGAKPAHARWVTAPKGSSISDLQNKYFPGSSGNPKKGNIVAYGKNYNTLGKGINFNPKGKLTHNVRIQV